LHGTQPQKDKDIYEYHNLLEDLRLFNDRLDQQITLLIDQTDDPA
jgi:hypothetical protein